MKREGIVSDQHAEFHWGCKVIYDDLGFCGCGQPEEALKLVLTLLRLAPFYDSRPEIEALLPDPGVQMIVLYTLDHAELIEHGGGVGGSWLTDKGERFLALLEATDDWDEITDAGYSCSECNRSLR